MNVWQQIGLIFICVSILFWIALGCNLEQERMDNKKRTYSLQIATFVLGAMTTGLGVYLLI